MDRDALFGKTVAALRGEQTQKSIADAMRARGFKWSQATVWSIESGERPLRAAEAEALAEVLGTVVTEIYKVPAEAVWDRTVMTYADAGMLMVRDAAEKLRDFRDLQVRLAQMREFPGYDDTRTSENDFVRATWEHAMNVDEEAVMEAMRLAYRDGDAGAALKIFWRIREGGEADGEHPEA